MVLDRRSAQPDLVFEAAGVEHVITGKAVVADHASALAHADGRARRHQDRALEAGHLVAQEPVVLPHLAAAFDLGVRELLRVGGVDVGDAGHVHGDDAGMRCPVPRPFEPRQRVVA